MLRYSTPQNAALLSRKLSQGLIQRIAPGVYTDDLVTPLEHQVRESLLEILDHLGVRGTFAYRSALEFPNFAPGHEIVLTGERKRDIVLPGWVVRVYAGNDRERAVHFTTPVSVNGKESPGMRSPSLERAIIENLLPGRASARKSDPALAKRRLAELCAGIPGDRVAARTQVEHRFLAAAALLGAEAVRPALDEAVDEAFARQADMVETGVDFTRTRLFHALAESLAGREDTEAPVALYDEMAQRTVSFFEAYFSNYIEGTEFEVEEAERIVFDPTYAYTRHADGHDVIETWRVIRREMDEAPRPLPANAAAWIADLKDWHRTIFAHRAEILAGEFKHLPNRVGDRRFVLPELVEGTLRQAFDLAKDFPPGMSRATFLKAAFLEVHPFQDGNGRISRLILNRERQTARLARLVVPAVYRDDYLTAMKAFSRGAAVPYLRMMDRLVRINQSIDWRRPIKNVLEDLRRHNAFSKPEDAMWGVPRSDRPEGEDDGPGSRLI